MLKGSLSGSAVKNPAASAGDTGSIPGLGRSPGGGNVYPLQYSCLENFMDRGHIHPQFHPQRTVEYSTWGRKELDTTE